MALSDTKLRSIYGKPYSGPAEITDSDGLSVRVTPKGVINFQYRFRWEGKQHRLPLGKYPGTTLRDARNKATEIKESIDRGIDPRIIDVGRKTVGNPTVGECLRYWEECYFPTLRDGTKRLYTSMVLRNMREAFPGIPAVDVPVKAWVDLFSAIEKESPTKAHILIKQTRSAIGWCIRRQFLENCEVMKILPKDIGVKPTVGEITLSYNQLAKIWIAIERSRASTANCILHQMLMLYGARNSEVREAVYSEFNIEEGVWVVPSARSKTKKIIRRPIFKQIAPFLEKAHLAHGEVLFSGADGKTAMTIAGANRFLGRIQQKVDIGPFTSHDFRRTLATRLSEEGVAPHVIEKMLGHELGGVLSVYNKHDWIAEQKEAYELHAEKLFWHIKRASG
ncbi:integrase [Enterobacterales bacterium CwR94]|nr:integrase [Enterobacterales bacterium CwR94]